jgi:putative heme-binding domain-containing protein
VKEFEFAAGAENDPYGFKPTDLVVQRDGALFVSDWADGQRPKRGRGRIYRITSTEAPKATGQSATGLDSESYSERVDAQLAVEKQGAAGLTAVRRMLADGRLGPRGRSHAVWVLARGGGTIEELMKLATSDPEPSVRAQAIRAIADLADPVLVKHCLDAGPGDAAMARQLAAIGEGADDRLRREVVIALGRLKWAETPTWIAKYVSRPDAPLAHAAMQAMRAAGNWPAVLKLLDQPTDNPVRSIALRAVAGQYEPAIVDGLIERLKADKDATRRQADADLLARVYRKPGPWVYWGYRPGPRPANTVDWDRTSAIATALHRTLADPDRTVRLDVLKRMQREKVPVRAETLTRWLREERSEVAVGVILDSLRDAPAAETKVALGAVVRETGYGTANRMRALALFVAAPDTGDRLLEFARGLEDGPVLAEALRLTGRRPELNTVALLAVRATSPAAEVRAAAVEALAMLNAPEGKELAVKLLADRESVVRRAAAAAAGKLEVKAATDHLLQLARDSDAGVRVAALESLRRLKEPRSVPPAVAALDDRETQLVALELLGELGGPEQAAAVAAVARRAPPVDVLAGVVRVLAAWADRDGIPPKKRSELERSIAEVHGATGVVVRWIVVGPVSARDASPREGRPWLARVPDWRINPGPLKGEPADAAWLAHADVVVPDATAVEFTLTGAGAAEVWLNDKSVFRRTESPTDRNSVVRFRGDLLKGPNSLRVRIDAAEFGLTFRRASATADHEKLTRAALAQAGNAERGRAVFFNAEKSLCVKCHRVGDQGERVGPELTGIGARFGRAYLIESILEPSRSVVPGFAAIRVDLADGRALTGVKTAENDTTLTLVDPEAKKHELKKADILEQRPVATSAMPEGLEKRLTEPEFVDLIAYLVSLKDRGPSR